MPRSLSALLLAAALLLPAGGARAQAVSDIIDLHRSTARIFLYLPSLQNTYVFGVPIEGTLRVTHLGAFKLIQGTVEHDFVLDLAVGPFVFASVEVAGTITVDLFGFEDADGVIRNVQGSSTPSGTLTCSGSVSCPFTTAPFENWPQPVRWPDIEIHDSGRVLFDGTYSVPLEQPEFPHSFTHYRFYGEVQ